jgi:hypothetical protein
MAKYTRWLSIAAGIALIVAIVAIQIPIALIGGLLTAGLAGSCVSVMARMPTVDITFSGQLEDYGRRILCRVGVGAAASVIGCSLLVWGVLPLSVQGQSFPDVFDACSAHDSVPCSYANALILLGIPMLIGFSERALTSFEQTVFGRSDRSRGGR